MAGSRAFLLARTPDEGAAELEPADARHAWRVLRLAPGERIDGLDGRGGVWPLEVVRAGRDGIELRCLGPATRVPAPGETGAPLPWIEVASAEPRGARAEELCGRLVQLGAAAWTRIRWERANPAARGTGSRRTERLSRIAREALKQSRRTWELVIHPSAAPSAVVRHGADVALLDRDAAGGLAGWCAERRAAGAGRRERPLVLAVGPEGGLAEAEREALVAAGARPIGIGPHVLRIETAAEAALAIAADACRSPPR